MSIAGLASMPDPDLLAPRMPAAPARGFATTRWSMIVRARDPGDARRALEEICRAYRHPVLAYIRRQGHPPADAEDLAQAFFTGLLEARWDTRADPARGRFRAFLLTALRRFLANHAAARTAGKRGGGRTRVDFEDVAEALAAPAGDAPDRVFERAWALTVLERAMECLRQEAAHAGKSELFRRLSPCLGEMVDNAAYRRLGEELGLRPNTVAVSVHRLRLRLRELVWSELADQTTSAEDLDGELRALRQALLPQGGKGGYADGPR